MDIQEVLKKHKLWLDNTEGGELADLRNADLRNAVLRRADLRNADLSGADLRRADLTDAKLPHFQIPPEEGAFIGWKKLRNNVVAKVQIPKKALRTSSLVGRKCRASEVKTLELFPPQEAPVSGLYDHAVTYFPGLTTKADPFDPDIRVECTHGIHFFMTRRGV